MAPFRISILPPALRGSRHVSTQFFLSPVPNVTYSACLVSKIEQMFVTGRAPYPIERTLLTSGILEAVSLQISRADKRLNTPHLDVILPPARRIAILPHLT